MARANLPPEAIAELFAFYDSGGKGFLEIHEVCLMLTLIHRENLEDTQFAIRQLVKLWDGSGDGPVSCYSSSSQH